MKDLLLKAKHWHYFLLTFGIPMCMHYIAMDFLMPNYLTIDVDTPPNFDGLLNYFQYMPFATLMMMLPIYGWMWAVGNGLQKYIPDHLKMNTVFFNIVLVLSLVFYAGMAYAMTSAMGAYLNMEYFESLIDSDEMPDFSGIGKYLLGYLVFFIISLYCYYFSAKTIKTAEVKEQVSFGSFVTEFFLHWIFYIGIWMLQPRIHKIMDEDAEFFDLDH